MRQHQEFTKKTELNDTEKQYVSHGYDFGNYSSRAIQKMKAGDTGVKVQVQTPSSSTKKENRHKTANTVMSAYKDADLVLRSTWNMVTEKGRGSVKKNRHGGTWHIMRIGVVRENEGRIEGF